MRKGTREKDNGEKYSRKLNTRDILIIISSLGIGSGGGIAGNWALSPDVETRMTNIETIFKVHEATQKAEEKNLEKTLIRIESKVDKILYKDN